MDTAPISIPATRGFKDDNLKFEGDFLVLFVLALDMTNIFVWMF